TPDCPDCTDTNTAILESSLQLFKEGVYQDTDGNDVVNVGDEVLYTFTVVNTGQTPITGVTITDPLVTVQGGPIDLAVEAQDSTTFTAIYTITEADIEAEAVYNLATVTGTNPDGKNVTDTSEDLTPIAPNSPLVDPTCPDCTVTPLPIDPDPTPEENETDIAVTKSVNVVSAYVGEEVIFTVTVSNLGTIEATNVVVTDELPSGYRFTESSVSKGSYDQVTGAYTISSLMPNETVTLSITAETTSVDAYINVVTLTDLDQTDTNPLNDEAIAIVEINSDCFKIFNVFTPNGDGRNDYFTIRCIENYPNNVVRIYNRWGIEVFEALNYQNNWDGTSNGRATINKSDKLPTGTYYYVVDLGDGSKVRTGWLYIN
ncbi:T9SS type B sorting domain-containing protein, partial [Joostella sp. CR20]|uniref:T9SS type B sorting domain-containing protein n=1 Tax=Joostella sp. CR20 TaxID=2804312 RepID=UPI00313E22FD